MMRALPFVGALLLAAPSAIAQQHTVQSAATAAVHQGVPVQRIVSPGGIEAWLVSDSTVPIIVVQAYWRGGSAIEPPAMSGVTGVMADMLTEGAGDLDSQAFKRRIED